MKFVAFVLSALLSFAAWSQAYPNRPVKVVVPYAAGGLPDTIARLVGQKLGESLGQQMVVENRGGAGGIVGTNEVAKAAPDGYTLLVSLAANDTKELIALARSQPGKISYGSSGLGSIHHLAMEALKTGLQLDLVHVPYKGTGQSVPALLGGQVALLYSALLSIESHVKAGKVKILAISTAQKAVKQPDVVQRFGQLGIDPVGSTPEAYNAANRASFEKYAKVVRAAGVKIE